MDISELIILGILITEGGFISYLFYKVYINYYRGKS